MQADEAPFLLRCAPSRSSIYHIRMQLANFPITDSWYVPAMVTPAHRLGSVLSLWHYGKDANAHSIHHLPEGFHELPPN